MQFHKERKSELRSSCSRRLLGSKEIKYLGLGMMLRCFIRERIRVCDAEAVIDININRNIKLRRYSIIHAGFKCDNKFSLCL